MSVFHLSKRLKPSGDQPQAIQKLVKGFKRGNKFQTLLGVTGSGKTFTIANVIQALNKPTLVISHNKTLAAQLYEEFKELFPQDYVHYFVSYYDYYQPEAYLPASDTYIEKEAQINEEIEKLRHAAVQSVLKNRNTIIVASVSCIYNLGSPQTYQNLSLKIKLNQKISKREFLKKLLALQFERNEYDFWRGKFRQRAEFIDVWPSGKDLIYRVQITNDQVKKIIEMEAPWGKSKEVKEIDLFPAKFWLSEESVREIAISNIKLELEEQIQNLQKQKKFLEAERLKRRTLYDLALIAEVGWCKGIENYSRYFDGRQPNSPPFTLIDYFPSDFLLVIDESHITIPQLRGMVEGDKSRKKALIEHGFRLPSALDNRPLTFQEFLEKTSQAQCLFSSATPAEYEIKKSDLVVEQIVRPTFILDPEVEVRKTKNQIPDLVKEILQRIKNKERVLVTVLTKKLSETLAQYLKDKKIKAAFLHSEIDTLERPQILFDLRQGKYDVLVGVNLLREGLDLPEVSLVAILDADKEGFLRDKTSFIQVAGRAARSLHGKVIMYADKITKSMKEAIKEMERRRAIQEKYNQKHHKNPQPIIKEIISTLPLKKKEAVSKLTIQEEFKKDYLRELKQRLELAQRNLQFEKVVEIKELIEKLKKSKR